MANKPLSFKDFVTVDYLPGTGEYISWQAHKRKRGAYDTQGESVEQVDESKSNINALVKSIKSDVERAEDLSDQISYELSYDDDDTEYYRAQDELEELRDDINRQLKQLKKLNPKVWKQVTKGKEKYWDRGVENPRKRALKPADALTGGRAIKNRKRSKSVAQGKKAANPRTKSKKVSAYKLGTSKIKAGWRRPDQYDNVKSLGRKLPEEVEVDEALTHQQRVKASIRMKKMKSKIKMGRDRAAKRSPTMDVVKKRAFRKARLAVLKKMTKGQTKGDLSFSRRADVEKRLEKKKALIQRLAKKLIPDVRKIDRERRAAK